MSSRRDVLKLAALAGAATLVPGGRVARAIGSTTKKHLIMISLGGGWDTTYAVDPKTPGDQIDIPATGSIVTHGALDIFEDPSRPEIGRYFDSYAAITAVVRGIRMPSVAHEACMRSILTGARNETDPDLCAIVAQAHGPDLPIPYLVLGEHAFAGPYAASTGRAGATNQLVGLLDPSQAYPVDGLRGRAYVPSGSDRAYLDAFMQARATRERAIRGATGYNKRRIDDFVSSWSRGDLLRTLSGGLGQRGVVLDLEAQRTLALDALATGISHTVMMSSLQVWDTHENNASQGPAQNLFFQRLHALIDDLAGRPGAQSGTTMLDDTIVVVVSEMGRTPRQNTNTAPGKDHWPVTSAMVIGSNIRGQRAWGGTTTSGEAELVDFDTGAIAPPGAPNASSLLPKNFAAGVLRACNVDPTIQLPEARPFDVFVA